MITKNIICIGGYARSGKDTIADYLIEHINGDGASVIKLKFADSLRNAIGNAYKSLRIDVNMNTEDNDEKKALRGVMVSFGEYARSRNEDVFVDDVIDKMDKLSYDYFVISDLRYSNEYSKIKKYCKINNHNFYFIDVTRKLNNPANEVELINFDKVRLNRKDNNYTSITADDGDLNELKTFSHKFYKSNK